jgi:hypothetical protein
LPCFFGQQFHDKDSSVNMTELVKPGSESEKSRGGLENILRPEEAGGLIIEVAKPIMSLQLGQIVSKNEAVNL